MKGSTKLFKIFGIDIKLHFSWWFIFALLAWSLSSAFFPQFYPDLSEKMYWMMGLSASLLLFVSVLLHELSHSLVAKAKNIRVDSITLFFFGGVAGIGDEDMKPMDELQMALAGPLFSLLLGGVFFLLYKFNGSFFLTAISFYLYQLNLILAIFNLVPGFPLDGGRAFRAILYAHYKDLKKATRIAVAGGKFFAGVLILLGIFGLVTGTINGVWFILLGGFLYFIAGVSYEQVVIKEVLKNVSIKEVMEKKIVKIDSKTDFDQALKKYYDVDQDVFVIMKGKQFMGLLDLKKIDKMGLNVQHRIKVGQLVMPKSQIKGLKVKDNCYTAFKSMAEQDLGLIPVFSGDTLKGVVLKRILMHRLVLELKYNLSVNKAAFKDKRHRKKVARTVKRVQKKRAKKVVKKKK